MAWLDQVPKIVDALAKKNGGRFDSKTPFLRVGDMPAVLGLFSSSLPTAIRRIADAGTIRSDFVTSDGLVRSATSVVGLHDAHKISVEGYLFASYPASSSNAWKRIPNDGGPTPPGIEPVGNTFEPARHRAIVQDDKLTHITFLRETISAYQRANDRILEAVGLYGLFGATRSVMESIARSFFVSIRDLAGSLDVLQENPPTTFSQDAKKALGAALDASAEATAAIAQGAGEAAAWAGNVAGKVAGSAAGGFLEGANLTTLAVAAIVLYAWVRRGGF